MAALLNTELHHYGVLKERLVQEFPLLDDATIRDTLEGITNLHEMIAAVIRSALVDEALHAGLRLRIDDMRERLRGLSSEPARSGNSRSRR